MRDERIWRDTCQNFQNTKFCHKRVMSHFSSPVSAVYARNARDHDPPFAEENVAFSDSGFPMEARVMNLIRYINRKKYFKNISTCLTTSFKTIMDTATLTGLAAGIGWIANKVLKMNFTADPSSNVKNYAKFTAVMAGSIALKQYPRQEDSS